MSDGLKWRIYGASDDLIEVEGGPVLLEDGSVLPDGYEFDRYARDAYVGRLLLGEHLRDEEGSGGREVVIPDLTGQRIVPLAVVHAIYDGCWSFAFGLYDEDQPFPEDFDAWRVGVVGYKGHSAVLEIAVPDRDNLVLTYPVN